MRICISSRSEPLHSERKGLLSHSWLTASVFAAQFQHDAEEPDYSKKIEAEQERLEKITVHDEEAVADYHNIQTQINSLNEVRNASPICIDILEMMTSNA